MFSHCNRGERLDAWNVHFVRLAISTLVTTYRSTRSYSSRSTPQSAQHNFMHRLLGDMKAQPNAWPFLIPVNGEEVVDYYEVIKRPMGQSRPNQDPPKIYLTLLADLSTMEHKLNTNQYQNLKAFLDDAQLIYENCRLYNPEGSIYVKQAAKLEKFVKELVADYAKRVA